MSPDWVDGFARSLIQHSARNAPPSLSERLEEAFRNRNWNKVKSLHRNNAPRESCWLAGRGWWLSTETPPAMRP